MVFGGCGPLEEVDILVVVVVGGCDPLEQVNISPHHWDSGCHLGTGRCGRGS